MIDKIYLYSIMRKNTTLFMKKLFTPLLTTLLIITSSFAHAQQAKEQKTQYQASIDSVTAYHYKREELEDSFVDIVQKSELKMLALLKDSNYYELHKLDKKTILNNLKKEDSILTDYITLVSWWRKKEHIADNPEGSFDLTVAIEASKKAKIAIYSLENKEFLYTKEYVQYIQYIFIDSKAFKVTTR